MPDARNGFIRQLRPAWWLVLAAVAAIATALSVTWLQGRQHERVVMYIGERGLIRQTLMDVTYGYLALTELPPAGLPFDRASAQALFDKGCAGIERTVRLNRIDSMGSTVTMADDDAAAQVRRVAELAAQFCDITARLPRDAQGRSLATPQSRAGLLALRAAVDPAFTTIQNALLRSMVNDDRTQTSLIHGTLVLLLGVMAVMFVTARSRERAIVHARDAEGRFRRLLEMVPLPLVHVDAAGRVVFRNEAFVRVFGYTENDVPTMADWWQRAYPDPEYRAELLGRWAAAVKREHAGERVISAGGFRITCKDGRVRTVDLSAIVSGPDILVAFVDVTDRIKAEEAVQAGAEQARRYLQKAPIAMAMVDYDGSVIFRNDRFVELIGYSEEDVRTLDQLWAAAFPDPAARARASQRWEAAVQHAKAAGSVVLADEYVVTTKDGTERHMEVSAAILDEGLLVRFGDVTARRRAEQALRLKDWALNSSAAGISMADLSGHLIYANAAFLKMWGYQSESEVIGKVVSDFGESQDQVRTIVEAQRRDGFWQGELAAKRRDGTTFTGEMLASVVLDTDGKPVSLLVSVVDISDRKRAEAESRTKDLAIDSALAAISMADLSGRITYANPAFLRLWGYDSPQDVIGQPVESFGRDGREVQAIVGAMTATGRWQGEFTARRRDGTPFVTELAANLVREPSGAPVGLLASFVDITERKRAERDLKHAVDRLELANRATFNVLWDWDATTDTLWWNDNFYSTFGYRPDDITPGMDAWSGCLHPDDRDRVETSLEAALTYQAETWYDNYRFRRSDGSYASVVDRAYISRDRDGKPLRMVGAMEDITERERSESQMRQLITDLDRSRQVLLSVIEDQKRAEAAVQQLNADLERRVEERTSELAAANRELDSFAYSVSHDLRAPLRAMSGFGAALVEDYGDRLPAEARGYVTEIISASAKMGQLVEGLLVLSRSARGDLQPQSVDVSAMARRICGELGGEEAGGRVAWTVEPGLTAWGDDRLLEVIMRNLLGNAWKYAAKTPEPTVRVYGEHEGDQRSICVADNGVGFDMRHAGQLFQPFRRLHRQDEFPGLGIGLATVQRVVHRHGGRITASGEVGKGATFKFTLPPQPSATVQGAASRRGSER